MTRVRHDGGWVGPDERPNSWDLSQCIGYCLEATGKHLQDVDCIVENHVLGVNRERFQESVESFSLPYPRGQVQIISHHLAHAYSAYYASAFDDALVVVIDGVGSPLAAVRTSAGEDGDYLRQLPASPNRSNERVQEVMSAYSVRDRCFSVVRKDFGTASIGLADRAVTAAIFRSPRDAGKTMGLAAYGRKELCDIPLLHSVGGAVEYSYVRSLGAAELPIAPVRWPDVNKWSDDHWVLAHLAARLQAETEHALLDVLTTLRRVTRHRKLCLAGGVALNSVANRLILDKAGLDEVFVVPAARHDGVSLGCAYWGAVQDRKAAGGRGPVVSVSWGTEYSFEEITAASTCDGRLLSEAIPTDSLVRRAAQALTDGNIVGWFDSRSEFGPRALGNRSILANPMRPDMKSALNDRVKFREAFRPFGPIVPAECAQEWFDIPCPSPFMLLIARPRPGVEAKIPSAVHVDGTARLQTVSAQALPRLHALLHEFARLSGVPILINTSLNLRGEPIVETPNEAVDCLLSSGLDALCLDKYWVIKREIADGALLDAALLVNPSVSLRIDHVLKQRWEPDRAIAFLAGKVERVIPIDSEGRRLLQFLGSRTVSVRRAVRFLSSAGGCDEGRSVGVIREALRLNLCRLAPDSSSEERVRLQSCSLTTK